MKFVYFLRQNHPFVDAVVLVSSGGLVEEALKIGRIVRQNLLNTFAPVQVDGNGLLLIPHPSVGETLRTTTLCEGPACHCASACFLIWAAGVGFRSGDVGVHRPTIQSTAFANLPPEQASILYRALLADIATYLSDMEVPQKIIDLMSDTASNDIKWLNSLEAKSMLEPLSIAEWDAATCGAMTKQEDEQVSELFKKGAERRLSNQDQAVLDANLAKAGRIELCGQGKKARFRDAMALPQTAPDHRKAVQDTVPATCAGERLAVAQRFAQGGTRYFFQALALCPAEFCPTIGKRIIDAGGSRYLIELLRYCPEFCPTVGRRLLSFHFSNLDMQIATLCPNL